MTTVGRRRKAPQLLSQDGYWMCFVRDENDRRKGVRFGAIEDRPEHVVRKAFGDWLAIYTRDPQVVSKFSNPFAAIESAGAGGVATVGELLRARRDFIVKGLPSHERGTVIRGNLAHADRLARMMNKYLSWQITEFMPQHMEAVRDAMVAATYRLQHDPKDSKPRRYLRPAINRTLNEARRMFTWGVYRGMVEQKQAYAMQMVPALRPGQTDAPEPKQRDPITVEEIKAVLARLTPNMADLVRIIWYTGARPEEVCIMRFMDIDRSDPAVWIYLPGSDKGPAGMHKMSRKGKARYVALTSLCQQVLAKYGSRQPDEYIFSPKDSVAADHPMIKPGDHFPPHSVYTGIRRAAKAAGVVHFSTYDLRRTAATWIDLEGGSDGLEQAKESLGHSSTNTTRIYLRQRAKKVARVALDLESKMQTRQV